MHHVTLTNILYTAAERTEENLLHILQILCGASIIIILGYVKNDNHGYLVKY